MKRAMTLVVPGQRDGGKVHGPQAIIDFFERDVLTGQRRGEEHRAVIPFDVAAAADEAHNIVESIASVPSGKRLADLAQLVVTITLGIAMEEVLRPGTIDPDLLANLITGRIHM